MTKMTKENVYKKVYKAIKSGRPYMCFYPEEESQFLQYATSYLDMHMNGEYVVYRISDGGVCLAKKEAGVPLYLEMGIDWEKLSQRGISPERVRNALLICMGPCGFSLTDEVDGYEHESFLNGSARIPFLVHHGQMEDKENNVRLNESEILDFLYRPL